MELDQINYHPWQGRLQSPWWASLAIVRVALLQVIRTKAYWLVLALGIMRFLMFSSVIYAVTQFALPPEAQRGILQSFGFSSAGDSAQDNGYINFINGQNVIVMILLAFSGSLLVGSEFRTGALPFYLARRIDKRHYIVGKLLAISAVVSLLTVVPALLLFIEYGLFTSSAQYWVDNWRIPLAVLAFGAVLCLVNSILLVTISAYLERIVPIAITWASLFLLLNRISDYLYRETDDPRWRLLDLWRDTALVGRLMFGRFRTEIDQEMAWWAAGILAILCGVALAALVPKVRAVEVVA